MSFLGRPDLDTAKKIFGYSEEQTKNYVLSSEKNKKILSRFEDLPNFKVIFECVSSENCSLKIKKGDKFVFSASGLYLPDESTANPCIEALTNFAPAMYVICERVLEGLEPNKMLSNQNVQCHDIGIEHGGWGKTIYKVRCVKDPHNKFDLLDREFIPRKRAGKAV